MDLTYLRLIVDERIASGGSEADTSFTDVELIAIATQCENDLYLTASEVWRIKAGLIQDRIANYSIGSESVTYVSLLEAYNHAIALSMEYKNKGGNAAKVFSQTPPDVLHSEDEDE